MNDVIARCGLISLAIYRLFTVWAVIIAKVCVEGRYLGAQLLFFLSSRL
jgi:hypothetical protein